MLRGDVKQHRGTLGRVAPDMTHTESPGAVASVQQGG